MSEENVEIVRRAFDNLNAFLRGELTLASRLRSNRTVCPSMVDPLGMDEKQLSALHGKELLS
jgi:hypothetical protein